MNKLLKNYDVLFWDFDGVIKDSVEAKAFAYQNLFKGMAQDLLNKIQYHHQDNGGVSRYEKIPLYLYWAGFEVTQDLIDSYCQDFSKIVMQLVINSPWVPGVKEYIIDNHKNNKFFLITATPTEEIKIILEELSILDCFAEVHGAPIKKYEVVEAIMHRFEFDTERTAFVGDSVSDHEAAFKNDLTFVLRSTALNYDLQKKHKGLSFKSLI